MLHEPHARYVKLRVAHALGMPRTFSPPPRVSDPDMHHGKCVTHVPWHTPGSLISGFLWSRCGENVPSTLGACATRNLTYLVRGPPSACYQQPQMMCCFFVCVFCFVFFQVKLAFEMLTARATAFIFDTRTDVLVKVSKVLRQKLSRPERDSNPNLRIHAECSNHLSYQGQTFAVPCFWTLALVVWIFFK